MTQDEIVGLLQRVAAGRREYAASLEGVTAPGLKEQYDALMTEGATFDSAAKIAAGETGPLYGLLPSWWWSDEMDAALRERRP